MFIIHFSFFKPSNRSSFLLNHCIGCLNITISISYLQFCAKLSCDTYPNDKIPQCQIISLQTLKFLWFAHLLIFQRVSATLTLHLISQHILSAVHSFHHFLAKVYTSSQLHVEVKILILALLWRRLIPLGVSWPKCTSVNISVFRRTGSVFFRWLILIRGEKKLRWQ